MGVLYEDSHYGSAGVGALMAASVGTSQADSAGESGEGGEVPEGAIQFLKNVGWKRGMTRTPRYRGSRRLA